MIPMNHFSSEITDRCLSLTDWLYPLVMERDFPEHGGCLDTTFLLAMAMPAIIIPMERIDKKERESPITDRNVDCGLTEDLTKWLNASFKKSQLRSNALWYFKEVSADSRNTAEWFADDSLNDFNAKRALNMTTRDVLGGLRNALAHGGVFYLDDAARLIKHGDAAMLAFVWDRIKRENGAYIGVDGRKILLVSVIDFHSFLKNWCGVVRRNSAIRELLRQTGT